MTTMLVPGALRALRTAPMTGVRRLAVAVTTSAFLMVGALPVAAGAPIDVSTLNPIPPDFYSCKATGGGAICTASTVDPYDLEPTGIICGSGAAAYEVLDSGTRNVKAMRWYDADGNLTRRERVTQFSGVHLTNPTNGHTLAYKQHNTDQDVLAVPGDLASSTFTGHGHMTMTVPGKGVVLHEAGRTVVGPDGLVETRSGPSDLADYFAGDVSVVADLCAALA
jgi:hypothetical protein